ncbi:hypothetical protein C6499_03415 [Candidatus Poribacteria bacterium]|nr:MAG: hypothetical protein C6499_03415 [Candidatus Poribacteria bacterium]
MRKKCLSLSYTTLMVLTVLLFVCFSSVEALPNSSKSTEFQQILTGTPPQKSEGVPIILDNSVLNLIPKGTLGVIYCPNLLELDNSINALVAGLSSELEIPDVSEKTFVQTLGMEFASLTNFEEIGFDLNQDFAILFTSLKPLQLSLLVHLTDPEAMKQMIEAKGSVSTEYKGVTYWNTTEGNQSFAILENTLVFSTPHGSCKSVIDTYIGTRQAVAQNPDYLAFLSDILVDTDQLAVYFDVESAIATLDRPLADELESIMDSLEDDDELEMLDTIAPFFEGISKNITSIEQVRYASLRLHIESTDIQIKPFLKFKSDSEYLEVLREASDELVFLGELPNQAFMNAAFQGSPKFLTETGKLWFGFFPKGTPEQRAKRDVLLEQTKDFYESLADRWSFSLNVRDPFSPVFIYELKDEQRAKTYMDETFLEKLDYTGAYPGKSIMHNRVEIKSYVFPNFTVDAPEVSPGTSDLVSSEWHWYYAFTEGQLLFTTGTSPVSMQMVLDRRARSEDRFSEHPSYQQLVDSLGTDNNVLLAISPITAIKTVMSSEADVDPNNAASLQLFWGMFSTLPETYSIGLAAKARDNGIGANLLINLGDFKQLGQMLMMLGQMMQMP